MQLLVDAGVKDTGVSMLFATHLCQKRSIRFLMRLYEEQSLSHVKYDSGSSLLIGCIKMHDSLGNFGPKMMRWLLDSGANTTKSLIVMDLNLKVHVNVGTPRKFLAHEISGHDGDKPPALTAIDRLLNQEEAVHAKSWLWVASDTQKKKKRIKRLPLSPSTILVNCSGSKVVSRAMLRYTRKV